MYKLFILLLLVSLTNCSDKPSKWVSNGTTIQVTKYRLEINDSSKILIENGENFTLLMPHDSLLVNKFTINYSALDSKANLYFRTRANQQVKNTLNPKVTEYYKFDNGNVLLLGYSTSDSLKPYTIFEPPLIISPANINNEEIKSTGVMKTFSTENNSFDNGFNTNLKVKELKQIKLTDSSNNIKACSLREVVLTRDATISYGENNLILPEAILFKTKSLIDQSGLPIAEWSIKVKKNNSTEEIGEDLNRKLFVEFTKYKVQKNKQGKLL